MSMKIVLVPVPGFPLFPKQKNDTEEVAQQPDVSHYKEDGSLEVSFDLVFVYFPAGFIDNLVWFF